MGVFVFFSRFEYGGGDAVLTERPGGGKSGESASDDGDAIRKKPGTVWNARCQTHPIHELRLFSLRSFDFFRSGQLWPESPVQLEEKRT
jgi:hypothetical protein